jgi:hypothetical protein
MRDAPGGVQNRLPLFLSRINCLRLGSMETTDRRFRTRFDGHWFPYPLMTKRFGPATPLMCSRQTPLLWARMASCAFSHQRPRRLLIGGIASLILTLVQ